MPGKVLLDFKRSVISMPYCRDHCPSHAVPEPKYSLSQPAPATAILDKVEASLDLHKTTPAGEPVGQIIIMEKEGWVAEEVVHGIPSEILLDGSES